MFRSSGTWHKLQGKNHCWSQILVAHWGKPREPVSCSSITDAPTSPWASVFKQKVCSLLKFGLRIPDCRALPGPPFTMKTVRSQGLKNTPLRPQERKTTTNLDSVLTSRDISLLTKVHIIKAMAFPVGMYGCENWTIKKAKH